MANVSTSIIPLSSADAALSVLVGRKAAYLHLLTLNGFRVPDGVVVSSDAFAEFLRLENLSPEIDRMMTLWRTASDVEKLEAAQAIRAKIESHQISNQLASEIENALAGFETNAVFAVRSSSAAEDGEEKSWAGQFDTYLNVPKSQVAVAVKRCWASIFSARATAYSPEGYSTSAILNFGVIVQLMVFAEVAGVAFSAHPVSGDSDRVYIEAIQGLGDRLVSGAAIPFTATMSKRDHILLSRTVKDENDERLLSVEQITEIVQTTEKVETVLGTAADMEWAIAGGSLYVLQGRPITTSQKEKLATPGDDLSVPSVSNYELTFKVTGLSFLFCDILASGFSYLNPFFLCAHGDFRQYLPHTTMESAAREGYRWLNEIDGFQMYREEFQAFYDRSQGEIAKVLASAPGDLTRDTVKSLFVNFAALMRRYSRMDFQFTNLTFHYASQNSIIRENLALLSKFKDIARAWVNATLIEPQGAYSRLTERLAAEFGVPRETVEGLAEDEVLDMVTNGSLNNEVCGLSSERSTAYGIYFKGGHRNYLSGARALSVYAGVVATEDKLHNSALFGQVANKPVKLIKGAVRVINVDYADLAAMESQMDAMADGEVLVSEFTAPELTRACRKASAIVTDLGGMLSHAAIISREFGVPCLVGTRFASKVLRNGDVIELDLEAGAVSVLKRTSRDGDEL